MPMIEVEVRGIYRQTEDIISLTRRIADIALRLNERLIAENVELKRELASRPPSRQGRLDH